MTDFGAAAAGMPPLLERRRHLYDYYRMQFLPDGYPARLVDGVPVAHPLYGTYAIADYLAQYRTTRDPGFLAAARRVADAALARMDTLDGELVFTYRPGVGLSSLPVPFYSGLTQARWLDTLSRLMAIEASPGLAQAGESILRSLRIPADRGGVMRQIGDGIVIEEYVHDVPDFTLNGWTTALTLVDRYAAQSGSSDAADLLEDSVRALETLLPLYDMPHLANSRYRLTGQAQLRLDSTLPGLEVVAASVHAPGFGDFAVASGRRHKWRQSITYEAATPSQHGGGTQRPVIDALLLTATIPARNVLSLRLRSPQPSQVRVSIGRGDFDPRAAYLSPTRFEQIAAFEVGLDTSVRVPIPWVAADLVAYPTSWTKVIGGKAFNVYHFIHVATLEKLAARHSSPALEYYAERWAAYPKRWPEFEFLRTPGLSLDPLGSG